MAPMTALLHAPLEERNRMAEGMARGSGQGDNLIVAKPTRGMASAVDLGMSSNCPHPCAHTLCSGVWCGRVYPQPASLISPPGLQGHTAGCFKTRVGACNNAIGFWNLTELLPLPFQGQSVINTSDFGPMILVLMIWANDFDDLGQ